MSEEKNLLKQMQDLSKQAFPTGKAEMPKPKGEDITVEDLDTLIAKIFETEKIVDEAKAVMGKMNISLESMKAQAAQYLHALKRKDYQTPYGTVSITQKYRVSMPQTDEDKAALFQWMRERGIYDKYATVHAQALNSLYMAEWEAAKRSGEGMTFSLPGVGEPKLYETLGMRKPRSRKGDSDE
jgi:hypothetical protein